jgi:hypothetical protein
MKKIIKVETKTPTRADSLEVEPSDQLSARALVHLPAIYLQYMQKQKARDFAHDNIMCQYPLMASMHDVKGWINFHNKITWIRSAT